MNQLLNDENELLSQRDAELTLSTGAILGIFLGLVVLCGVFFGFGYNMGRKSTAPGVSSTATATGGSQSEPANSTNSPSSPDFDSFKPPAGSPAQSAQPGAAPANTATTVESSTSAPTETPAAVRVLAPGPEAQPVTDHSAPTAKLPEPKKPVPAAPAAATPAPLAGGAGPVVQIAAVSHEQDAQMLVDALRGKGYQVVARSEPQDKLMHIQIGPFASRKDAEDMRQRLLADGYNAIVK